jgi:hypothetical protein
MNHLQLSIIPAGTTERATAAVTLANVKIYVNALNASLITDISISDYRMAIL